MNEGIKGQWKQVLDPYFSESVWTDLKTFVENQYLNSKVFPPQQDMFNALAMTPFESVKVVVLGQDPYHNEGQAHGLAFSVPNDATPPPSLKNIYKELFNDLGIQKDMSSGNLTSWAQQGVLLLNSVLTVEENRPGSHAKKGWESFTDAIISSVSSQKEHCVFLLWGAYAKKKGEHIDRRKHLVLESAHPSPLSAHNGFFGNHHFSQTNEYLKAHGKSEVKW